MQDCFVVSESDIVKESEQWCVFETMWGAWMGTLIDKSRTAPNLVQTPCQIKREWNSEWRSHTLDRSVFWMWVGVPTLHWEG